MEIDRKINRFWITLGFSLAAGSVIFGFLKGPRWIGAISGLGILAGLKNLGSYWRHKGRYPGLAASLIVISIHAFCLTVALVLFSLFLSPLKDSSLKIPSLVRQYNDPQGLFSIKGPADWDYRPSAEGVRIKPVGFNQYMGVAEVDVTVRRMDTVPPSPDQFLLKMVSNMSKEKNIREKGKKAFHMEVSQARLLNKKMGVWSVLDIQRLWIRLRQVSLFGIKKNRYFCSVTVTGLEPHSTLFNVLGLGLFETLEVTSPSS